MTKCTEYKAFQMMYHSTSPSDLRFWGGSSVVNALLGCLSYEDKLGGKF